MLAFPFSCPIHASVLLHAPHFHHYLHHWENPLVVHLTHSMLCMSQTQVWGRISPLPWIRIRGSQHILFDDTSKELHNRKVKKTPLSVVHGGSNMDLRGYPPNLLR